MRKVLYIFVVSVFLSGCFEQMDFKSELIDTENNTSPKKEIEDPTDKTPEDPRQKNQTKYRFSIISDLNGSYGSKTYSSDVKSAVDFITKPENKIDFVLSTGDMVAGQKSGLDYKGMWTAFHNAVTRKLHASQIPLFPSPGNHDAHIGRTTERRHYEKAWQTENPLTVKPSIKLLEGVEQNFPYQYAFRMGTALFISIDDTAVQSWKSSTLQWLEGVLSKESDAKLKFIYGHVPILPFAFKKDSEYAARGNLNFLNQIENLFEQYKVDVFFSGHSHVYYPGRRDLHTEYISVPLLGGGTRYLISRKSGLSRSEHAFLVVEYDDEGNWSLEHREARRYNLIDDREFPTVIDMPSSNSSLCKSCSSFPRSHFLDSSKRVIYRRRDL